MHEAIDAGITFFDTCWEYYDGKSEDWLGRALAGKRDEVFLMTKVCTHGRGADLAMRMLEESLRRLQTDHLDLWQIHGVCFDDDPELAYRKGGVIEALELAKRQGKARFVGFTGHKDPAIHLEMITRGFPFDTVQMPLNCFDATFRSFEQHVLPEARAARHLPDRHEEPRRLRRHDQARRRDARRGAALRDEPPRPDHGRRDELDRRAAPRPLRRARASRR